jgi:O-antigen/teichoic acid export membrane protein
MLLPILTRKLTPEDYGIVSMFQLAVSLVYPFIGLNLDGAIGRKYYDKNNHDFSLFIGSCLVLFLISLIIVSIPFLLYIDIIQYYTQIPKIWLKFVLIVSTCQFLTTTILVLFQIRVQPIRYGLFQILQSILNIALTLVFVFEYNKTWDGRIEAQIFSGIIFALISIYLFIRNEHIKFNIKKSDILYALKFGIPLIPHALGGILFSAIDRFFLTNLIGLKETGNYSVAYQLGAIVGIITISVNNAFVPWLFENLNKNLIEIKKHIVKWTYIYFFVLIFVALFLLLILPFGINFFIGKSFKNINSYTTLIVFGFVFQGMYYMVINYITYVNKTYLLAFITISIALIKIPITYYSIIWFGAFGASLSFCLTFFLFFISTWILSASVYKMPWLNVKIMRRFKK